MLNLKLYYKLHIPNGLAALAAILLLVSSVATYSPESEIQSANADVASSVNIESTDENDVSDSIEHKRRGLNLGSLLFRR